MDAATNGRSTRDRAAAANTTSGPSGELIPVLMRIPDVRPPTRGKAKRETVASPMKETVAKETAAPPAPSAAPIPPLSDAYKPSFEISYPSNTAKEKTVHLEAPVHEPLGHETDVTASNEKVVERVVDSAVATAKESSSASDEGSELPTPAANESTGQPSTNRRQRQRRTTEAPKTSWWKTQGRALAAVFVIGLGVTIYFSRGSQTPTPDTVHEDESAEGVDITTGVVAHEELDHEEFDHGHSHAPHVASKPKTAAPALTEQPSYDEEPLDDASAGLGEAEEVEPLFTDAEEATQDVESDVTSTDEIDFGELPDPSEIPDRYEETAPETYRDGGRVPRTANNPNSSSSR